MVTVALVVMRRGALKARLSALRTRDSRTPDPLVPPGVAEVVGDDATHLACAAERS